MARLAPFKAIRPERDKVHLVASRSYMSYGRRELREKLDANPFSFIHIINPEYSTRKETKPNTRARFKKVRQRFEDFVMEGTFVQDKKPAYYIYRQTHSEMSFTGVIAGVSIDDYLENRMKKHEHTLTRRERMFTNYLEETGFNAEPVLLTYPHREEIDEWVAQNILDRPEFEFTTTDRVKHELWPINDRSTIRQLTRAFQNVESTYIADGHHRSASSALLGQRKRKQLGEYSGNEPFNYVMALLIPDHEMLIRPFHRLLRDLNGHSVESLLDELSKTFIVEDSNSKARLTRHQMKLYVDGAWYLCKIRKEKLKNESPVAHLDPWLLDKLALEPVWGISDLKTDKRASYIGGEIKPRELSDLVDSGKYAAIFEMHPVSTEQLMSVADAGESMPPKSTWVEPKLRSGLTMFSLLDPDPIFSKV